MRTPRHGASGEQIDTIERALARKGWTRVRLAKATGYDERTIRNVLSGRAVRTQTILDICQALQLGADALAEAAASPETAAEVYGGYSRRLYEGYVGAFVAYRRSFLARDSFLRTLFEFAWEARPAGLVFHEHQRYSFRDRPIDHSQQGRVHISPVTDLVHLVTAEQGAVRLITLTKMKLREEMLRGVVLTQSERTMFFRPSVSALFLRKLRGAEAVLETRIGPIGPEDPEHAEVAREIERIERDVVLFPGVPFQPAGDAGRSQPADPETQREDQAAGSD